MAQRESNFELCRIFAILLVILVHSTFNTFGWPNSVSDFHWGLVSLASLSLIGVNVFVLISGYFSIKPKKSSVINLLFICAFYACIRIIYGLIVNQHISWNLVLFISNSNWFVVVYLGLLIIAPMMNNYIERLTKKELTIFILAFSAYQIWFGFIPGLAHGYGFGNGYSLISFMLLYAIGRFINLYGVNGVEKSSWILYILFSTVFVFAFYFALSMEIKHGKMAMYFCGYNNPLIIASSIAFFLIFKNIKMNGITSKIVNHLSKSSLAVLFLSSSPEFFSYSKKAYTWAYSSKNNLSILLGWCLITLIIYFSCVLIDQLRQFTYKAIKSTKIYQILIKQNK